MSRIRSLFPWALGFVLGAVLVSVASQDASFTRRETVRLHAHFARVLAQLHARDVSSWSAARQESRRQVLALLADYDRTGCFPRNEGQLARRTPIFIDRHETRCAMAYLIERSGGASLVARIAATRDLAYIRELANDAELSQWLAGSGLTLDEAALIQPEYNPPPVPLPGPPPPHRDRTPSDAVMNTGVLVSAGFALPAIVMSLRSPADGQSRAPARTLAILAATPAFLVGLADAVDDGHLRGSGVAQVAIGATSMTFALLHHARARRGPSDVSAPPAPRTAPIYRAGSDGELQLGMAVAF